MKRFNRILVQLALGVGFLIGAAGAQATTVVNDNVGWSITTYNRGAYADQLTEWLGKGSLTLTNIFDNVGEGVLPAELDAAVAGKGPTFTILRVGVVGTGAEYAIGWYNPLNGVTAAGGNAGETSLDSFIFNLSTDRVLRPVSDTEVGNWYAGADIMLDENFAYWGGELDKLI